MLTAEQFIYGPFQGRGLRLKMSAGANTMLSEQNMQKLQSLKLHTDQQSNIVPFYFPQERVISISFLRWVTADGRGRQVWNHTFLFHLSGIMTALVPQLQSLADSEVGKYREGFLSSVQVNDCAVAPNPNQPL
jgi:hypothetical protein